MRRRRSRLPWILAAGVFLILATTLGMVVAGVGPGPMILSWLPGASATVAPTLAASDLPSSAPSGGVAAASAGASSSEAAVGTAGPSTAPSGSAGWAASPSPSDGSGGPASPSASRAGSSPVASSPAASGSTVSVTTARAIYNGSRANKVVALTFDDGYNPVALRQILAILKREHVAATFFPYGWATSNDPAGWKLVTAAGFPIGNHTQTHATLTTLTPEQVTDEMNRARRTIDLYSGGKSGNYMRPPGGAFNAPTSRAIAKAGYPVIVMWDVDTFDWQGPSVATITARATRGTNGSIVLMHSGPLNTPKALPAIIANYRARGFTFATIPELLEIQ